MCEFRIHHEQIKDPWFSGACSLAGAGEVEEEQDKK